MMFKVLCSPSTADGIDIGKAMLCRWSCLAWVNYSRKLFLELVAGEKGLISLEEGR